MLPERNIVPATTTVTFYCLSSERAKFSRTRGKLPKQYVAGKLNLILYNVKPKDSGTYVCKGRYNSKLFTAKSNLSVASTLLILILLNFTVTITVLGEVDPNKIKVSKEIVNVGDNVTLRCLLDEPKWFLKLEQPVPAELHELISSALYTTKVVSEEENYTIARITIRSIGYYNCYGKGGQGHTILANTYLKVYGELNYLYKRYNIWAFQINPVQLELQTNLFLLLLKKGCPAILPLNHLPKTTKKIHQGEIFVIQNTIQVQSQSVITE